MDEPLIYRAEVRAALFALYDAAELLKDIRDWLRDDGEEEEEAED